MNIGKGMAFVLIGRYLLYRANIEFGRGQMFDQMQRQIRAHGIMDVILRFIAPGLRQCVPVLR